jgi:hypothetical protein
MAVDAVHACMVWVCIQLRQPHAAGTQLQPFKHACLGGMRLAIKYCSVEASPAYSMGEDSE